MIKICFGKNVPERSAAKRRAARAFRNGRRAHARHKWVPGRCLPRGGVKTPPYKWMTAAGIWVFPFSFVTEREPERSRWFRMQRTHDQRGFPPLESPEARYRPGVPASAIPHSPDGRHLAAPSTLTPRCAPLRAGRGKPFCRHLRNVRRGRLQSARKWRETYHLFAGRGLDPAALKRHLTFPSSVVCGV